jgi:glycosyltransferase involved in cell wall biosynthesis
MTDEIAVSVIIPLYNRGGYIKRAIDSVLRQTRQNFEIIVVDGHSTDDGSATVRNFQDRRIIFIEQEGRGVSTARNQGVDLAKSDFIAFLDADDEWSPRHLDTIIKLRKNFPDAGMYVTATKIVEPSNLVKSLTTKAIPPSPWEGLIPNFFQAVMHDMPFNTSCVGIPKNIFIETGGFLPGIQMGEDRDLWIHIALKYRIAFSWEGETIWHEEANNRISNTLNLISYEREPAVTRALAALESYSVSPQDAPFLKEFIANCELNRALWNIKSGQVKKARDILRECKTSIFYRKKIRLTIFSYIPRPVFTFLWKTVRVMKQNLFKHDYGQDPWLR